MRHPKSWTHFDYGMITWQVLRLRISPSDSDRSQIRFGRTFDRLRPESHRVQPDSEGLQWTSDGF